MRSNEEITNKIKTIKDRIKVLKTYLLSKYENEDWHGVEDAGSDIRDEYARIAELKWVLSNN